MTARLMQESTSLTIRRVEETAAGGVIAVTETGTILRFDTAADVTALIEGLEPARALLEAREAAGVAS
jgi:hypothetical protein